MNIHQNRYGSSDSNGFCFHPSTIKKQNLRQGKGAGGFTKMCFPEQQEHKEFDNQRKQIHDGELPSFTKNTAGCLDVQDIYKKAVWDYYDSQHSERKEERRLYTVCFSSSCCCFLACVFFFFFSFYSSSSYSSIFPYIGQIRPIGCLLSFTSSLMLHNSTKKFV